MPWALQSRTPSQNRIFIALVLACVVAPLHAYAAPPRKAAQRPVLRLRRGPVKVHSKPAISAPRRGIIGGPGSVFPRLERRRARGCRGWWYRIAPAAWICSRKLRPGMGTPRARQHPRLRKGRRLPHRYAVLQRTVTVRARPSLSSAPVRALRKGSGVVLRPRVRGARQQWRRSRLGYIPARALRLVRPSRFSGVTLSGSRKLPRSWVTGAPVWACSQPTTRRRYRVRRIRAYSPISVLERKQIGKRSYARIGPHLWVRADRVRTARRRARLPAGLQSGERWIHVDLKQWTLVAYQGRHPVFATLIARGRKTPRGRYRITIKRALATLRLFYGSQQAEVEAVPWVQYFRARFALHSAYWHDQFGSRYSHGCVHLSPTDASWLFRWTAPRLRPGWYSVRPAPALPGTRLIIQ